MEYRQGHLATQDKVQFDGAAELRPLADYEALFNAVQAARESM